MRMGGGSLFVTKNETESSSMNIEVLCSKESRRTWIQRVVIGILLASFAFGCNDPVRRAPISSCLDIDTTPIDELLAHSGQYLSAPPDSAMSPEDSGSIEKYRALGEGPIADREEFLKLTGLFYRMLGARRNHELLKICPTMILESRRRHPDDPGIAIHDQDICASAAFYAGDFAAARGYLDSSEAGIAEGKIHGMTFDGLDELERLRMRAEISSLWRRDREVLRLLVPKLWGERVLQLAVLRTYPPKEIPEEFDRAIENLKIDDYEDAPPSIQKIADTIFGSLGKGKEIGWTRLFGVDMVFCLGGEEPFFGFPREAYVREITESSLYAEMYCLPSSKGSAALLQNGGKK
ncbi:MAG: hypothetical protein IPO40_05965 [Fibrobacteres bacterium]|nr:hypothetical protein [Fibrobacterota bacterium]